MNRAAVWKLKSDYEQEIFDEIDVMELATDGDPSSYHTGNQDPYSDLQDTQEMNYMFHK